MGIYNSDTYSIYNNYNIYNFLEEISMVTNQWGNKVIGLNCRLYSDDVKHILSDYNFIYEVHYLKNDMIIIVHITSLSKKCINKKFYYELTQLDERGETAVVIPVDYIYEMALI